MDVIRRAQRWAWSRPRVLLVDAPGADLLRWTVEAEVDRRGWACASSPAETDLLVVLGTPGEELSRAIDVLWSQVPQPRHRSSVGSGTDVGQALDTALEALLGTATGAPLDEQTRSSPATLLGRSGDEDDHAGMGHDDHAGMGHGGHEGLDTTGHTGSDHDAGTKGPDHNGAGHTGHEHGNHGEHADADDPGHGGIAHAGHQGLGHSDVDHAAPEGSSHGGHADHGGADHDGRAAPEHGGHAGTEHEGHEAEDPRHEVPDDAGQQGVHYGDAAHAPHPAGDQDGHAELAHDGHAGMDHSGHAGMGHGDMGHGDMGHGDMGHGDMGHGGHGGMDHGSMQVAGLPMADTAPDRDGLQLDALAVALGPVLHGWPTGLLLHGKLQGDVLTDVSLCWVDAADHVDGHHGDRPSARLEALDHLARFLDVAGWPVAARDARRARNELRAADPARVDAGHRRAVQLARRVRRSRTLAWSVRGIGAMAEEGAQQLRGDVLDRVRWWCRLAAEPETTVDAWPEPSLERMAELLQGAELAAARLIVASVPLTRQVTGAPAVADA